MDKPKALCIRFIMDMAELLKDRAPRNWRKFDSFLDIFHGFMVHSEQEIYEKDETHNPEGEAYKIGVESYFLNNMIKHLGDFILQENSPYQQPGQIRTQMGGNYGSPNLSGVLKTIIIMISDRDMMTRYPLDELNNAVV